MEYFCKSCLNAFAFEDDISFCPYCGSRLNEAIAAPSSAKPADDSLAHTIDSIWGGGARLKKEFSSAVDGCINLIHLYADKSMEMALPKEDISQYEKNYDSIRQSNNRKTLVIRIEKYLDQLNAIIQNLNDRLPANVSSKLECAVAESEDMTKELYDFIGIRYTQPIIDFFDEENYSAEVLYTKEQLQNLYGMVLTAYGKYKKCVEDNNMFAAFASTSNYGTMTDYWRRWLSQLSRDDADEDKSDEERTYEHVIEHMEAQNSKKYFGMLDEDFVPHVDAFWYGLEMLCTFIDNHINVKCNTECFFINEGSRAKIHRTIVSNSFEVTEDRLESLFALKERFEEKYNTIDEK